MTSPAVDIPTADQMLRRIRASNGAVPLAELQRTHNLTQVDVLSHLAYLADCDYKLRLRRDTVTFQSAPDLLTALEIEHGLKTARFGRVCHAYQTAKSTNDLAMQLAENGAPEGTIVTAEQQTKGRGRLGRSWHSPAGLGIYLSLILRPDFPPERAPGLSVLTGIAVTETIRSVTNLEAFLKWPNDVYVGGKKCAGILTELSAERGRIHAVIVGVGINVNHGVAHFPDNLRRQATSLRRALGRKVTRIAVLQEFLRTFEKMYARYQRSDLRSFAPLCKKICYLRGRQIVISAGAERREGIVRGVDDSGRLLLDCNGMIQAINAGDVSIVK